MKCTADWNPLFLDLVISLLLRARTGTQNVLLKETEPFA
jgi:hypothetical protein